MDPCRLSFEGAPDDGTVFLVLSSFLEISVFRLSREGRFPLGPGRAFLVIDFDPVLVAELEVGSINPTMSDSTDVVRIESDMLTSRIE